MMERLCLMIWMLAYIASLSAIGMGLVILLMYEMISFLGAPMPPRQAEDTIEQMSRLMLFGIATLPSAIFLHLIGLKYLHFEQHEDSLDHTSKIGPMWDDQQKDKDDE